MPVGVVGELLTEGPHLARCFKGNFKRTAAAFVENWGVVRARPLRRGSVSSSVTRYLQDGRTGAV